MNKTFWWAMALALWFTNCSTGTDCKIKYILPAGFRGSVIVLYSDSAVVSRNELEITVNAAGLALEVPTQLNLPCQIQYMVRRGDGPLDTLRYYPSPALMAETSFGVTLHERGGSERNGKQYHFETFLVTDRLNSEYIAKHCEVKLDSLLNSLPH